MVVIFGKSTDALAEGRYSVTPEATFSRGASFVW